MKKIVIMTIMGMFLTACQTIDKETEQVTESVQESLTETINATESEMADNDEILLAYQKVLLDLIQKQIWPDGTDIAYDQYSDLSDNQFAIIDIDQDQKEELLILYTTTSMAAMVENIYGYNETTGEVYLELSIFPNTNYYANGMIEAGASHNQGLAGNFWPYTLYQYNAQTDQYEIEASVDAWDREVFETDFDGQAFPVELDISDSGIIYYVTANGETESLDAEAYKKWYNETKDDANLIKVPYAALSQSNIDEIMNAQ